MYVCVFVCMGFVQFFGDFCRPYNNDNYHHYRHHLQHHYHLWQNLRVQLQTPHSVYQQHLYLKHFQQFCSNSLRSFKLLYWLFLQFAQFHGIFCC